MDSCGLGEAFFDISFQLIQIVCLNLNTNGSEDGLIHCFKEGEPCQNGREQLISQLDVLDKFDRPNPFDLITDSDVDEAENVVFRIEEDDEIILHYGENKETTLTLIYRIITFSVFYNKLLPRINASLV